MKLVVGLGNPGRRYQGTRHNVGFDVLAELAREFGSAAAKSKFHGEIVEASLEGERALLLGPLTYMNKSGLSVYEAKSFYKIPDDHLLVLCDDLNLPVAKLRFRAKGSSGGQKGLEDIVRRLGTENFARLRIGTGPPPERWDWADYVLAKFTQEEVPQVEEAVRRAARAAVAWARHGVEFCMNQYN